MNALQKRPWLRALCALGLALLFLSWLLYAMIIWDGRLAWGGRAVWPKSGTLPILRRIPEGSFGYGLEKRFQSQNNSSGLKAYLFLLPLPLLTFTLTALLPESLGKLFPRAKRLRTVYGVLAGLALCFGLLCTLAGCTTLLRGLLSFAAEQSFARIHMLLIPISGALAVLGWLLPCAVHRLLELGGGRALLREAGGGARRVGLCFACAFAVTAASCLLLASIKPLVPQAVSFVAGFCGQNATYDSMFFVSVCMAPLMEELAFRGLIQRGLRKSLPAWAAVVLTSVFFGLWHRNTGQFVYTFLFALMVGAIYEQTGKLRYTWLCHMLMNLFAVMGYSDSPRALLGKLHFFPWLRKLLLGLPAWAAAPLLLLVVAGIVLLVRLMRAKSAPKESFSEEQ